MDNNWFKKLFVNEAKPALERHSGGGDNEELESLREELTAANSTISELEMWKEENAFAAEYYNNKVTASNKGSMFRYCDRLTTVPLFDTSNVTSMTYMFEGCSKLTTVPLFDTSKVVTMLSMFSGCSNLTIVPLFDLSSTIGVDSMFMSCIKLETLPLFNTSKVTTFANTFQNCTALTMVPSFDARMVTNTRNFVYGCKKLVGCYLRNIKADLQVGSGMTYGHLLTLDSLKHLIYELRNTGSMKTLTVGSANLDKLANVYVKIIDITDEMRAEDDLIDEKLPYVVCESTDEGAMLIRDYVFEKNWQLK